MYLNIFRSLSKTTYVRHHVCADLATNRAGALPLAHNWLSPRRHISLTFAGTPGESLCRHLRADTLGKPPSDYLIHRLLAETCPVIFGPMLQYAFPSPPPPSSMFAVFSCFISMQRDPLRIRVPSMPLGHIARGGTHGDREPRCKTREDGRLARDRAGIFGRFFI